MRLILVVWLTFCFLGAKAQVFKYPVIKTTGKTIQDFVPEGWKVIDSVFGDLNNDGKPDAAFIMEYKDILEYKDSALDDSESAKPRVIVVLFKNGDKYKLACFNNDFILRADEGGVFGDPLEGFTLENGLLGISFYGGDRWRWSNYYRFKYQGGKLLLITATLQSFDDVEGDAKSIDYLPDSGFAKVVTGDNAFNEDSAKKAKTVFIKIKQDQPYYLDSLKNEELLFEEITEKTVGKDFW